MERARRRDPSDEAAPRVPASPRALRLRRLTAALLAALLAPPLAAEGPEPAPLPAAAPASPRLAFRNGAQRWVFEALPTEGDLLARLAERLAASGFQPEPESAAWLWAWRLEHGWAPGTTLARQAPDPVAGHAQEAASGPLIPRPAGRRGEAREVLRVRDATTRFEWVLDGLAPAARGRLARALTARGAVIEDWLRWSPAASPAPTPAPQPASPLHGVAPAGGAPSPGSGSAPAPPRQQPGAQDPSPAGTPEGDVLELLRRGGTLPPGYVPHGHRAPEPLPELPFLGGTLVLLREQGRTLALLRQVPEGSGAQKIGLGPGDALLELDGRAVDPASLAPFAGPRPPAGRQRTFTVRRSQGAVERLVLDSWAR